MKTQLISIAAIILFLLVSMPLLSAQQPGKYRVTFTDKNNTPYSVSNPLAFLSQRAIDRRTVHNIPVTIQDIPVNQSYINGVVGTGVTLINKSRWFNSITVLLGSTPQFYLISALSYVSAIEFVAPLPIQAAQGGPSKLDMMEGIPYAKAKTDLVEKTSQLKKASLIDYGMAGNQIEMIKGDMLHDAGFQGQGMVIAVIDAGFTSANILPVFDSLWMNGRILGAVDFAEPGGNVFSAHSHGTMVLSIMGGNIPGQLVGTAPKASYWLLRSEIGDTEYIVEEDNWVSAAEFADSAGVDIINSSLGYTEYWDSNMNHTYASMDGNTTRVTIGADIAAAKGMIVVNSAGNSGSSPWGYIGAPADGDSVVAVGAVDYSGTYVSFSSRGPSYDGRVKPDVTAQGSGTVIADIWGNVTAGSGTSFSSPVIAGAIACLWQASPSRRNMEVVEALKQSAHKYSNPDSLFGYGIPDYWAASLLLGTRLQPTTEGHFHVYPNPFDSHLHLLWMQPSRGDLHIRLHDMAGRLLMDQHVPGPVHEGNAIRLPQAASLHPGMYILHVSTDGWHGSTRLIKATSP